MNILTYYSVLQSIVSPEDMVKACANAGYKSLILCDNNSLSGVVDFYKECKKREVKPIIGACLKVCETHPSDKGEYNRMYDLYLIAKNKTGYKNLLKIINIANNPENILDTNYQRVARVSLDEIQHLTDGVACLQGVDGTELAENPGYSEYTLSKYKQYFKEVIKQDEIIWTDVRYLKPELKQDFHIVLCILLKCSLKELESKLQLNFPQYLKYINEDFSLKNKDELYQKHTQSQIEKTEEFLESCEEYDILSKPRVPRFECPDGMSQQEYLRELCRLGWRSRFKNWESEELKKKYADRVKYELEVLQGCELDGYFLLVQDYIMWAKRQGWLLGPGRGSVAGSLVAYLLGITDIDSIKYNLLFERFYSADRNAGGHVSLPDVDTDFPRDKRAEVIEYIETKYSLDKVAHIITFATLKGSGALEAVLKGHDAFTFNQIKNITKHIPLKDKISDKMQEQGETSVLMFTLKNYPKILESLGEYKDGEIIGEYSELLKQAIRIEGCIRGYGAHPSGILISNENIEEVAPLVIEANGDRKICALEMGAAEAVGLVKVDLLGLKTLDILMEVSRLVAGTSEDQ